MAEITPAEVAELQALLQADPAGASLATLRAAVAASKPKRPKTVKPPPPPTTALEQLKKYTDNAIAEAARVRALRLELEEIRKTPWDAERSQRRISAHSELNYAFCKLADTAEYLYAKLRAELDKLPDPEKL